MENKDKLYYAKKTMTLGIAAMVAMSPAYVVPMPVYATESVQNQANSENAGNKHGNDEKPGADGNGAPSSIADLIDSQKNVLSDTSVYQVRIGYEFDDGSFDEWARGTGYLVSDKYILTSQTLTDTSTKSNLFAKIQAARADLYSKVGISLSNQEVTEAHLKVYVTDSSGKKVEIISKSGKNGMGIISLKDATNNTQAIFATINKSSYQKDQKVNLKFAGKKDDTCDVQTGKGTIYIPEENKETPGAFYFTADTTNGNPLGAPIYDETGSIIGMVSSIGSDDKLTALTADALQTFLTSNGVTYKTLAQVQAEQKAQEEAQAQKDAQEAGSAIVKVDKLNEAIEKAEEVSKIKYTKKTVEKLEEAVKDANKILESSEKTQAQVDTATENINLAIDGLRKAGFFNQVKDFVFDNLELVIYGLGGIIGTFVVIGILSKELKKIKKNKAKKNESLSGNDESEMLRRMEEEDLKDSDEMESVSEESAPDTNYRGREFSGDLVEDKVDYFEENIEDFEEMEDIKEEPVTKKDKFDDMPGISKTSKPITTFGDGFDDEFEDDADIDITTRVQPKEAAIPTGKIVPGLDYGDEDDEEVENLKDDGSDDTTVLKKISAYLIRVETGRRIPITKNNFLIGKERKKVDYRIANNNSVSRIHARIFQDANGYCIEDQKSTNFTYVNNQQIPAYTTIRLKDGTPFRLSDVEFEFHIEE